MTTTGNKIITPVDVKTRQKIDFSSGDTVKVWQRVIDRIVEKDKVKEKTRLQAFEGLVLGRKHGVEAGATFTVRKVIDGVGVERIFPLYSPLVEKIEVLRRAKVRRAKLYHIRNKAAKEIRRQMRNELKINIPAPLQSEPDSMDKKDSDTGEEKEAPKVSV